MGGSKKESQQQQHFSALPKNGMHFLKAKKVLCLYSSTLEMSLTGKLMEHLAKTDFHQHTLVVVSDRQQCDLVNGEHSQSTRVLSGIP